MVVEDFIFRQAGRFNVRFLFDISRVGWPEEEIRMQSKSNPGSASPVL
jgi:hypothetical protein